MNTKLKLFFLAALFGVFGFAGAVNAGEATNAASPASPLYTCGMHPWIIQDHPGNCPICSMKLEQVHPTAGGDATAIAVDPATTQLMNLQTTEIARGPLRRNIRTVGTIDFNETTLVDVTTKFKGWIEKLDADATGQLVHRGEPLLEMYSPELYSAEAEFLATRDFTNAASAAAREKLKFLDVADAQIAALEKSRTAQKVMPVLAPADGFVIEKNVVAGQMADAGMKLYRLADLGIVWVLAQVYAQDLPLVQLGQEAVVKVASLPDREFRGRVTFVYPTVDEKTRTARVRLEFENPGYFLKPGMFVSAQIRAELDDAVVLVPDSAVLRSGEKNTVFVALAGGKFAARAVALGVESENGLIQVISGLNAGERVVTSGQFLLDSESQLREAIEKMRGPTPVAQPAEANAGATTNLAPAAPVKVKTEAAVYVCPMPEHVSIVYDHAGNCPICGMALVPVTPSALQKIQPGGKVLYYTCPMPEHASVHAEKPGKCPLCAMTLIPVMASPAAPPVPKYVCPMHTEVVSAAPGKCPKCEMELVPVKNSAK